MFTVYELSLKILKPAREFANNYFEFNDILRKLEDNTLDEESIEDIDKDILDYAKLLYSPIKSIGEYYNIRNQFSDDFYTSGKFKEYQIHTKTVKNYFRITVFYEFDETIEDYDFKLMREYYHDVKSFTILDKYYNLMFSPEELNKIISTQE